MNAREFAIQAHGAQKYGDLPYYMHLDDTVTALHDLWWRMYGVKSAPEHDLVSIAYLHDVLEDTKTTAWEIESYFGEYVANAVLLLTDPPGKNRRERKLLLYAKLKHAHWYIRLVKLADRVANVRASRSSNPKLYSMYVKERSEFKEAVYSPELDKAWSVYEAAFL